MMRASCKVASVNKNKIEIILSPKHLSHLIPTEKKQPISGRTLDATLKVDPYCSDDTQIDYNSLMESEELLKRYSENVADREVLEAEKIKKMYRNLQRQIRSKDTDKVTTTLNLLYYSFIS